MNKCPYCEGDINERAIKCEHCGEWLEQNPNVSKDIIFQGIQEYLRFSEDIRHRWWQFI